MAADGGVIASRSAWTSSWAQCESAAATTIKASSCSQTATPLLKILATSSSQIPFGIGDDGVSAVCTSSSEGKKPTELQLRTRSLRSSFVSYQRVFPGDSPRRLSWAAAIHQLKNTPVLINAVIFMQKSQLLVFPQLCVTMSQYHDSFAVHHYKLWLQWYCFRA